MGAMTKAETKLANNSFIFLLNLIQPPSVSYLGLHGIGDNKWKGNRFGIRGWAELLKVNAQLEC